MKLELPQLLLTFLFFCIGSRLLLVYAAKKVNRSWLRIMGFLAIPPAFGMMKLFIDGTRNDVGTFGQKVWWNPFRPIHSLLYCLFAFLAIVGNRKAWMVLLLDVCIGLFGFVWVHSSNGDFSKAFL